MSKIKDYLIPSIILCVICLVATLLLSYTNSVTAPMIDEIAAKNEVSARLTVFPQAASFGETKTEKEYTITSALDESGNVIGYVVVNSEKGYGGDVQVMTGVGVDGKVVGVDILNHSETAGLGANADKEKFRDLFKGLTAGINVSKDGSGENTVKALTGATITSKAVAKAVNIAIEAAGGENNG